ncbi:MAG TPA: hypothetical protein PLO89_12775, partial [Spirochaetota bacterium]|nr:hypothetical protein [Spirochaetota bacterium]
MERKKSAKDIFIEQQASETEYNDSDSFSISQTDNQIQQLNSNISGAGVSFLTDINKKKKPSPIQINMLKTSEELQ